MLTNQMICIMVMMFCLLEFLGSIALNEVFHTSRVEGALYTLGIYLIAIAVSSCIYIYGSKE